jgi:phasin family protein
MFAFTEPVITAAKASLHNQFDSLTEISAKAFDNVERIVDLNLGMLRASFEQSTEAARQMIAAQNTQEFFAAGSAQLKPQGEKLLTYSRHLADLASAACKDLSKVAEARVVEGNHKMIGIIETATKNAPAGSTPAIAMLKSALGNANAGYEQFSKSTRQAVEAMEVNLAAAVSRFAEPAAKGNRRASK